MTGALYRGTASRFLPNTGMEVAHLPTERGLPIKRRMFAKSGTVGPGFREPWRVAPVRIEFEMPMPLDIAIDVVSIWYRSLLIDNDDAIELLGRCLG